MCVFCNVFSSLYLLQNDVGFAKKAACAKPVGD